MRDTDQILMYAVDTIVQAVDASDHVSAQFKEGIRFSVSLYLVTASPITGGHWYGA